MHTSWRKVPEFFSSWADWAGWILASPPPRFYGFLDLSFCLHIAQQLFPQLRFIQPLQKKLFSGYLKTSAQSNRLFWAWATRKLTSVKNKKRKYDYLIQKHECTKWKGKDHSAQIWPLAIALQFSSDSFAAWALFRNKIQEAAQSNWVVPLKTFPFSSSSFTAFFYSRLWCKSSLYFMKMCTAIYHTQLHPLAGNVLRTIIKLWRI